MQIHAGPVKVMKYNHVHDVVISADAKGLLEYWSPSTLKFPEDAVNFRLKTDTNLFEIAKCKTSVSAIEVLLLFDSQVICICCFIVDRATGLL